MTDKDAIRVLFHMDDVTQNPNEKSAVVDFIVKLLFALGYQEMNSGRIVCIRMNIPLYICGKWKNAKTDVGTIIPNSNLDYHPLTVKSCLESL